MNFSMLTVVLLSILELNLVFCSPQETFTFSFSVGVGTRDKVM
jgi:hypothetical protein